VIQEPIQPTPEPSRPERPSAGRRSRAGIIGLVVVAGLALAVPVVGSFAAVTSRVPTSAVGASAAPASSADTEEDDQGKGPSFNNGRGLGLLKGLKGNGHVGRGAISITAISGSNLSLATDDGWTRTIAVTSTTVITKGGAKIGVADLKVKDHIGFRQTKNADGSFTIVAVNVELPTLGGTVTGKTSSTITVTQFDGTPATIHVSSGTTYKVKGQATGSLSDIAVGDRVGAEGALRADGSLDAVVVGEGGGPKIKGPKGLHPDGSDDPNEGTEDASPAPS
jgi:hypothetical protein